MKKFIIGAVVSTLATIGLAKSSSKKEAERERYERMQLERERLENQKQESIRKDYAQARENALNRQFIERENDKNRNMAELSAIRQARAANPIELKCPRCAGTRNIDRINCVVKCPYCRDVQALDQSHKYRKELDEIKPSPPKPLPQNFQNLNQQCQNSVQNNINSNTVVLIILCVLGFCCCCIPIPITYIVASSKKLSSKSKAIIISATWIVYLIIGLVFYVTGEVGQTGDMAQTVTSTIINSSFPQIMQLN